MRDLSPRQPVSLAVAAGATTPVPAHGNPIVWSTPDAELLTWDGSAWVAFPDAAPTNVWPAQVALMTSTQASSSGVLANITELALSMSANATYEVDGFVSFIPSVSVGLALGFTTPTGCAPSLEISIPDPSSFAQSDAFRKIFPTGSESNAGSVVGDANGTSLTTARIRGIVTNGANAGNLQLTFCVSIPDRVLTLQVGSILTIQRVA